MRCGVIKMRAVESLSSCSEYRGATGSLVARIQQLEVEGKAVISIHAANNFSEMAT
jgi:hypothetical protein